MDLDNFMNAPIDSENETRELVNVGKGLKCLRNKAGLSASKSCERLKEEYGLIVSVSLLNSYESDRRFPNTRVFFALCEMYGCNDISSFFEAIRNKKQRTQVTLEDYEVNEIVELLVRFYGKNRCVVIIQKMIEKLVNMR